MVGRSPMDYVSKVDSGGWLPWIAFQQVLVGAEEEGDVIMLRSFNFSSAYTNDRSPNVAFG